MTDLLVLINGNLAGRAFADKNGHPHFTYEDDWRNSRDAIPLSLSLPLAATTHDSSAVAAVMWGFLPDNEHVLQRWASSFQVSPRNPLALLAHVGEDCAGAAQFIRPERLDDIRDGQGDNVDWLDDAEVEQRLRSVRQDAGTTRYQSDLGQFSLPGAQPKIALHHEEGRWGIPHGRTPTTHILKPPTGAYEGYVENEHFCLTLAKRLGLSVCDSAVLRFGEETTICVTRYDRQLEQGRWWLVHQEDFCQALGVMPQRKYQNQGGPSPVQMETILRQYSSQPQKDRTNFFFALIVNWLIGGTDAHAKNYSLLMGGHSGVRLAPLYDISSALPYPQLDRRRLKIAMRVGSHYRWHDITLRDWLRTGAEMGFSADYTRHALALAADSAADSAASVADELQGGGLDHPIVDDLRNAVVESAERCSRMLTEVIGV